MILARLVGAKPEYTGVVAGMSGSPVYIDGKLLGALSYRIGQFSKEPIAGITPIEQMFQVRDQPAAPATDNALASAAQMANSAPGSNATQSATPVASAATVQPIETPLVFSGFSPEAIKLWQDNLPASGLTATSGIGGGSSNQAQPDPIVPGSAISAVLVRGDLDISATCTVTYVDAKQLLACGHPITQYRAGLHADDQGRGPGHARLAAQCLQDHQHHRNRRLLHPGPPVGDRRPARRDGAHDSRQRLH